MLKFNPDDPNAVVVMYPTGGYGNFLYLLLSQYLDSTVKVSHSQFEFSKTGHSHAVTKPIESFSLGQRLKKNYRNFKYSYGINSTEAAEQISQGKQFLILGDMGNLGDNIKFLRRYFTQAKIVRVHASTFEEKLVVWFNCMTKAMNTDELYPGSLLTTQGIRQWANKTDISDQDAVDCMATFFSQNFAPYGNYFDQPSDHAINVKIEEFFTVDSIVDMVQRVGQELGTNIINLHDLRTIANNFIVCQHGFELLDQRRDNHPLISRALNAYIKQLENS